jgi:hypothetical protein
MTGLEIKRVQKFNEFNAKNPAIIKASRPSGKPVPLHTIGWEFACFRAAH